MKKNFLIFVFTFILGFGIIMLKHYVTHDNQGITDKPASAMQKPITPAKPNPPAPAPIKQKTSIGINSSLQWLARHQNPDGHWDSGDFTGMCKGAPCAETGMPEYDTGLTGLSLTAFLDIGYTHLSKETYSGIRYGEVIKKGFKWIITQQKDDGRIGENELILNHCLATLALAEAYAMTESQLFKDPAQKAIDFLINSRDFAGNWLNTTHQNESEDILIAFWAIMALKEGQMGGLKVPASPLQTALNWIETNAGTSPEDTAIEMCCKMLVKYDRSEPFIENCAKLLISSLPTQDAQSSKKTGITDYFFWYSGEMAIYYYMSSDNQSPLKEWEKAYYNVFTSEINDDETSCLYGSYNSGIDIGSKQGGRIYATAITVMTHAIHDRYLHVFTNAKKNPD